DVEFLRNRLVHFAKPSHDISIADLPKCKNRHHQSPHNQPDGIDGVRISHGLKSSKDGVYGAYHADDDHREPDAFAFANTQNFGDVEDAFHIDGAGVQDDGQ